MRATNPRVLAWGFVRKLRLAFARAANISHRLPSLWKCAPAWGQSSACTTGIKPSLHAAMADDPKWVLLFTEWPRRSDDAQAAPNRRGYLQPNGLPISRWLRSILGSWDDLFNSMAALQTFIVPNFKSSACKSVGAIRISDEPPSHVGHLIGFGNGPSFGGARYLGISAIPMVELVRCLE